MTKKQRQEVYDKYGGRCAYSGRPLDDKWQVDHITPKSHYIWFQPTCTSKVNDLENLIPCLRILNHYKREKNLEYWRRYLSTLHERLKKLPKKTRVPRTENRIKYLLEVADCFGITADKPFSGIFYFETLNEKKEG